MKMITLMVTLLFCIVSQAGTYKAVGADGANETHKKLSECESRWSSAANYTGCYDVREKDLRYWEVQTLQVDDYSNPNWKAEYNVEACDIDLGDCQSVLSLKTDCDDEPSDAPRLRKNEVMPGWSVVCTRLLGYDQINKDVLVENQTLKASVQAADAAATAQQGAIAQANAARMFGETIVDMIGVKNIEKSLTGAQIVQVVNDYDLVRKLLVSGAIQTARDEMASMTPDGTRITQADKDEILAALDAYLAP